MGLWRYLAIGWALGLVLAWPGIVHALEPEPADPGYTPIFMMYTGSASHEHLVGLKQFMAAANTPPAVAQDTVDAVLYKLENFKAGFAYPIFMSETGRSGNACVVADGHHDAIANPASILASEAIRRKVLQGRGPTLNGHDVLENVLYHEMFHCFDLMKMSQTDVGMQVMRYGSGYTAYLGETGADAFSALRYLRAGGDKALLRYIRDYRTLNLLNGDAAHYTARTLDHIIWFYDARSLRQFSTTQLVELANRVREQTLLSPEEFAAVEAAAQAFSAVLSESDDAPERAGGMLQKLVYSLPPPEILSQLVIQVRSALFGLGGDISERNAAFHRVFKRYYLPIKLRTQRAELPR